MSRCPTRKRRYRDDVSAKLALANIRRVDSSRRPKQERRVYECPACRGYHLTSVPKNGVEA